MWGEGGEKGWETRNGERGALNNLEPMDHISLICQDVIVEREENAGHENGEQTLASTFIVAELNCAYDNSYEGNEDGD